MAGAIGDTISKLKEYVDVKTEQIKLVVLAKVSIVLSNVIAVSITLLFSFFLFFFLSFAVANVLNDAFQSSHIGFFLIAGFYLLIIIVVLILAKRGIIQGWIERLILTISEKEDETED